MGTAPSRLLVEEWSQDFIVKQLAYAIDTAVNKHQIPVIGATEHTTQTPPDFLRKIITTEIEHGAQSFCIADTIGIARPKGAYRIVQFVKQVLLDIHAPEVLVEWHGHDDQGNAVANALAAISAGANRIHTVARGRGERAGNTMMEALLLNLNAILEEAQNPSPWDIAQLNKVLTHYDKLTKSPSPIHGPLGGRSHTTSLGIHSAAMLKAEGLSEEAAQMGEYELAKKLKEMSAHIYSAVSPDCVGKTNAITVSPWSGSSTVKLAYRALDQDSEDLTLEMIDLTLQMAKQLGRELTTDELKRLLNS